MSQDSVKILRVSIDIKFPSYVHTCNRCSRIFLTEPAYLSHECSHMMDDHNYIKEEEKSVEKDIHNEEIFTYKEFNQNFIGKANSKRALWSCLICGTDFSWISQKDSHIRGVHSRIKTVKCAFCQVRFFYRSHRLRHMKLEHLTKYRCEKCKFQATTHARLMQHSIHSHRWKPSVEKSKLEEDDIPITDVEFVKSRQRSQTSRILKRAKTMKFDKLAASMSKIPAHSTTNKESQLAEEPTRNTYVPQNSQPEPETNFYAIFLQRYVETDPIDESRRYCKICEFDMHFCCVSKHFKDVHESKFHYSCSLCDDRFICPLQRINHMKLKHPDKNVCEHCSHQFNHAETYERHMAQCVEERNLPMKSQLREQKEDETPAKSLEHIPEHPTNQTRSSSTSPSLTTSSMFKSLETEFDVATHIIRRTYLDFLISHDENLFSCSICESSSSNRRVILCHLKTHHEVPAFSCPRCPEKFFFKLKFTEHVAAHKKEENNDKSPKSCETCSKSFNSMGELQKHLDQWHNELNNIRQFPMEFQEILSRLKFFSNDWVNPDFPKF